MKLRLAVSLFFAAAAAVASAAPRRVALVVQDHTAGKFPVPVEALADTLAARLSGAGLSVVNPANNIGTTQNRTATGEAMPEASAVELANELRADGVITASVELFAADSIGIPAVAHTLKARMALNLADAATGATVCGAAARDFSRNYTAEQMAADGDSLREDFLHEAAEACARRFLDAYAASEWAETQPAKVSVFFGCNVLGADIQIDGLARGTCPAQLSLSPGVHRVLVSYPPYYYDYARTVMFEADGQTFAVVLQITPEGEEQRERQRRYDAAVADGQDARAERGQLFEKQLALADAMLKRYKLSGATDDYVRRTIADGTSIYWQNSYGRVIVTDATAENIEMATPATDAADLSVPPEPGEIAEGLRKLLMKAPGK
jgi:hypothetical protein